MAPRYALVGIATPGRPRVRWEFGEVGDDGVQRVGLRSTPTGVGRAKYSHVRQRNAHAKRSTWKGRVDTDIVLGLDVKIGPVDAGDDALALAEQFHDSLGEGDQIMEFHILDEGDDRWVYARLEEGLPDIDTAALEIVGEAFEQITLGADQTYWFGRKYSQTFAPTATANRPSFAQAAVHNRGDVETWPFYYVTGPASSMTIGFGTDTVTLPAISTGQVWDISTDPEDFYIRNAAGQDVGSLVGAKAWFEALPPKKRTPLTITGTGFGAATTVKVTLQTLWQRGAA